MSPMKTSLVPGISDRTRHYGRINSFRDRQRAHCCRQKLTAATTTSATSSSSSEGTPTLPEKLAVPLRVHRRPEQETDCDQHRQVEHLPDCVNRPVAFPMPLLSRTKKKQAVETHINTDADNLPCPRITEGCAVISKKQTRRAKTSWTKNGREEETTVV